MKKWADATKAARKALGLVGFVPVGRKTVAGKALYAKAKSLMWQGLTCHVARVFVQIETRL